MVVAGPEGGIQETRAHLGEPTAHNHYLGVEDVDYCGQADAGEVGGIVEYSVGEGVAGLGHSEKRPLHRGRKVVG